MAKLNITGGIENNFHLGDCEVRPAEQCIVRAGDIHHIEPKSMAVLLALAANGSSTVSRADLNTAVWPRGHVTDDALNRCISQLRHALGDDPKSPVYIATVPRKGYRLVASVEMDDPETVSEDVLVLPFQHLSASSEDSYLADSLTELLIARLSVALDQPVISRTTAMSFKSTTRDLASIANQLGVKWVVEGSTMQVGDKLQIVVQLIDAPTDSHVWAETWHRPVMDALTVLNEISRLVAGRVSSHLEHSGDTKEATEYALAPDLLRYYLHGVQLNSQRTHQSLEQAIDYFEKVLTDRPDFAPALSGMAMSNILLAHYGAVPVERGFIKGRDLAQAALAMDSTLVDAKVHLAAVLFHYEWDYHAAQKSVEEALGVNPNLDMGLILMANCHHILNESEAALKCVDRAERQDPLNIGLLMNSGDHLILQQRYGEAIRSLKAAIELNPAFRPAILRLAMAYAYNDQPVEALACLEKAVELGGRDKLCFEFSAIVAGRGGEKKEANSAAAKLQQMADNGEGVLPWSLARAWASAGDADKAIMHLQQAYKTRSSSMPFLSKTPVFGSIRSRAEVQNLIKKVGLPL